MKNFKILLPVLLMAALGLMWAHRLASGSATARLKVERDFSDQAGFTAADAMAPYDPYFLHRNFIMIYPNHSMTAGKKN